MDDEQLPFKEKRRGVEFIEKWRSDVLIQVSGHEGGDEKGQVIKLVSRVYYAFQQRDSLIFSSQVTFQLGNAPWSSYHMASSLSLCICLLPINLLHK